MIQHNLPRIMATAFILVIFLTFSCEINSMQVVDGNGQRAEDDYWRDVKSELFSRLDDINAIYRKLLSNVIDTNKENCKVDGSGEVGSKVSEDELCPSTCVQQYVTGEVLPGLPGENGDPGEDGLVGRGGLPGLPGRAASPCSPIDTDEVVQCPKGPNGRNGQPGWDGERGPPGFPGLDGEWEPWPQELLDRLGQDGYPYSMDDVKIWVDEELQKYKAVEVERLSSNRCQLYCEQQFLIPQGP